GGSTDVFKELLLAALKVLCHPLEWWSSAASWAQAMLSAEAIYAAARLAARQQMHTARSKADTCVALITHAEDEVRSIISGPLSDAAEEQVELLRRQFATIPLESLPDFRLGPVNTNGLSE
ncbi:hypothetical protein, partial [Xanthomonas graminis]|uniref:hypothetical protein n=1 Tax=Xanthomonas graminis TaxID=3390026 RepID=UPI001E294BA3